MTTTTTRPPADLLRARERHAEAESRVRAISEEAQRLRDAVAAAGRALETAKASVRGGKLSPGMAQAVGERMTLQEVLADEEHELETALRHLADAEADLASLEREEALRLAAQAERELLPRLAAALAELRATAAALEAATSEAIEANKHPHSLAYLFMAGDRTKPQALAVTAREIWAEAAKRLAWKARDMGEKAVAERILKGQP